MNLNIKNKERIKNAFSVIGFMMFTVIAILISAWLYGIMCSALSPVKSWYCVRAKDHKQPSADADMRYIENYNGYYIDHDHGDDCEDKVVYLTFDAGYENGNVKSIVDTLNKEKVKGAFFILGNLIERNGDLVKQMVADGHTVCNHTNKHKDMTSFTDIDAFAHELSELENAFTTLTGQSMPKYFRPPEGKFNEQCMQYADRLGYKTIFWSFAYADWDNNNQMSPASAIKKITDNIHNGAVILLHPTSSTNAEIMPELIKEIKAMGYRFGTLDELCAKSGVKAYDTYPIPQTEKEVQE